MKRIDFKKGSGEFLSFAAVSFFICLLVIMMCAYIQLTIYTQKLANTVSVCARSVSVCTNLKDAKEQAVRVAKSALANEKNIDNIEVEVDYVTNDKTWTSGNFLKVTVSAGVHTLAPYIISNQCSKSTIVCIENLSITGPVINIPSGMGLYYTISKYDELYAKWSAGTAQQKLANKWHDAGEEWNEGIAIYEDCYLVATTSTFGKVGDRINVMLDNGLTLKCIIADIKSSADAGCNAYGHNNGQNVIEFQVKASYYHQFKTNPGNSQWHPEMKGKVERIINLGINVL